MLAQSLKDNAIIIALVLLYAIGTIITLNIITIPQEAEAKEHLNIIAYFFGFLSNLVIPSMFLFLTLILRVMIVDRPKRLIKALYIQMTTVWISPAFLIKGLIPIFFLYVFIFCFSPIKTIIPIIHPYGDWDMIISKIDGIIHFGVQPWVITHTIFSTPFLTFIINFFYNLWFFVLYAVFVLMAFICNNETLRKTYFISFFSSWIIIGTFLAFLFSSVGPCYYDLFYNIDNSQYTPLMAELHDTNKLYPIWALDVQKMLWTFYQDHKFFVGGGISAMPSMHVSIAFLHALVGYKIHKIYGRILLAFFFMILIGSIHLGWHYALDGYIAILVTTMIWFISGWIAKKTTRAATATATATP